MTSFGNYNQVENRMEFYRVVALVKDRWAVYNIALAASAEMFFIQDGCICICPRFVY